MQPTPQPSTSLPSTDGRREALAAALLVAVATGAHLAMAAALPLSPQEAYYWQWSRHLDLSYFDHPPLASWTIRAATALAGDSEVAIRLAAAFHSLLFSLFFFLAGRRLFGPRVALVALAGALATPLFSLGQMVITPDAPLLAGWAAALYFTIRTLETGRGAWLLAAGAAVGFASLGKYTGWLLAPQIFLLLLLDRDRRKLLATPWPWLGVAVAVAVFSPVLLWNARHDWVSFGFQFAERGRRMVTFRPGRLGRHLGLQSLAVTPLLFLALIAAAFAAARRWRERPMRVCAVFSLPLFLLLLAVSPFAWVKGNWSAPLYPAAALAAAAVYLENRQRLRWLARASVAVALAVTLYLHAAAVVPWVPFPANLDSTTGWKELAARVADEQRRLPQPSFVLGCLYKPASELAYYLPGRPETYSRDLMGERGLQYRYWTDPASLAGRDAILVVDRREPGCRRREELCRPLERLEPLTVRRGADEVTTFDLWRCRYTGLQPDGAGVAAGSGERSGAL